MKLFLQTTKSLKQNILDNTKNITMNMNNQIQSTLNNYKVSKFKILIIIN